MSLPKKNKLESKEDFSRIFRSGFLLRRNFLSIKFLKNNVQQNRFGIVISTKVSKKAVVRNMIKRRIAEGLEELNSFKKNNFDIVVTATPGILGKTFQEIKSILQQTIKEIMSQDK